MSRKKTEVDFEASLKQLETLVHKMENETLSLDEALACFEQGVALTKVCQKALQEAEQKVIKITQTAISDDDHEE
jgi:exodeoxyribonuclease VII small subunit